MTSFKHKLLRGTLLGDVVEELTGKDSRIRKFSIKRIRKANGYAVCSHETRIYAGRYLIAKAFVIWNGKESTYDIITNERMRVFLKKHRIIPIVLRKHQPKGILHRLFTFSSNAGNLEIKECIILKKLRLIERKKRNA